MVMDEAGRNGWNWHLAQQIVQPVIRYVLSSVTFQQQLAQHVIALSHRYGGIFISLISIKNFPPYPIIIIYNLLTNRWLEYGIITIRFRWI